MSDAHPPLIQGIGITLTRDGNTLLNGVDIQVSAGEIVTLIGPNGAGKSTLVKVLLGLLKPTGGTVQRQPGLTVGYLPQHLAIDPVLPLSVRRMLTLTQRATRAEQERALTLVGVQHLAGAPLETLSGGERQRILLARALLRKPQLLVLDEPTQGVDFAGEAALYQLIEELRDAHGYGVLMISHDLHLVMASTDRVVCLNHHICCAGEPESVRQHPEYLALFEPHLAGKLTVYAHHHDHDHDLSGEVVDCEHHADDAHAHGGHR